MAKDKCKCGEDKDERSRQCRDCYVSHKEQSMHPSKWGKKMKRQEID